MSESRSQNIYVRTVDPRGNSYVSCCQARIQTRVNIGWILEDPDVLNETFVITAEGRSVEEMPETNESASHFIAQSNAERF